jgi:hypothetical protein
VDPSQRHRSWAAVGPASARCRHERPDQLTKKAASPPLGGCLSEAKRVVFLLRAQTRAQRERQIAMDQGEIVAVFGLPGHHQRLSLHPTSGTRVKGLMKAGHVAPCLTRRCDLAERSSWWIGERIGDTGRQSEPLRLVHRGRRHSGAHTLVRSETPAVHTLVVPCNERREGAS